MFPLLLSLWPKYSLFLFHSDQCFSLLLFFFLNSFFFFSISSVFFFFFFFFFFSFDLCNFNWCSLPCFGVNGTRLKGCLLRVKGYLFVNPSCVALQSYCHGLPNNKWHACIGTTSQSTSSSYLPMDNATNTCLVTLTSPHSFSH
jgi:hypothetical protein